MPLVLFRETNLAAVAEYRRLPAQIHLTDVLDIAGGSGELPRAAGNVHGVGEDGEEGLREWDRRGRGWVKRESVS